MDGRRAFRPPLTEEGWSLIYAQVARIGYIRNLAYRWSHMINNLASALFGFIYLSLWQGVAPETTAAGDPYTRSTMFSFVILAQVFAWLTTFLPAGLGIQQGVRSGNIALEMSRPVPYFPLVMAREIGNVAYQALYRALPMVLLFAATVGFPRPASAASLLWTVPSLVLSTYTGLTLVYMVGISSLWTFEVRWAHWLYNAMATLLSGGWVPADIMPGVIGQVAPYLPFASQQFYPIRIYLGMSDPSAILIQAAWAVILTIACWWLTRQGARRLVLQGG